jgi:hypothetical protein
MDHHGRYLPVHAVFLIDPADESRQAEFDNKFTIPVVISEAHHEVHEGDSFSVDHVESGAGFSLCFKVPSGTKRNHIILSWAAESKAELSLFEGREWDASSGSLVTIYNRDRNSDNASQLQEDQSTGSFIANSAVILDPMNIGSNGNAAGTEIHHWEVWSDKKQTSQTRSVSEWILKNDEIYVVTFLSNDGEKGAQVILDFYEHTDE